MRSGAESRALPPVAERQGREAVMAEMVDMEHATVWSASAQKVLSNIGAYLVRMEGERAGWGSVGEAQLARTNASLVRALLLLVKADRLWAFDALDKDCLSFEGTLPSGIAFGMVARMTESLGFDFAEVEWTFHS